MKSSPHVTGAFLHASDCIRLMFATLRKEVRDAGTA